MYTDDYISEEEHANWFKKIDNDPSNKYWIVFYNDIHVGLICLFNIDLRNKRCYWGYYLADPSVRGKGIGRLIELNVLTYVFDELHLNKLCCEVLKTNDYVVKLHQKYGSKIEGIFRKHILKQKTFHDVVAMGILKEEWDMIKNSFNYIKVKFE